MKLDAITLEILNNKFTALTEEMCHTLQRTGRTLYVKETADFCCAIASPDGRFFAYPRGIGVSGFVGLDCLTTMNAVGDVEPGDVILTNDPWRSRGLATHLPDLQLLAPWFVDGELVAWGWAFLHSSDVGGRVPSSISPLNSDIYQEGLQVPPVKLVRGGVINQEIMSLLAANSRTPEANAGDLHAMLAALSAGQSRFSQIALQHGTQPLKDAQWDLREYAATRAREVLRQIPAGTYHFEDYLDDEAGQGLPVRLKMAATLKDGNIHLDFSGSDPQVAVALNIPSHGDPHAWLTLRVLALICTLDKSIPLNAGLLEPISLFAPTGSIVNPRYPAAVGVRHATAVRVNDLLNGMLGQALPDVMPAASGGTIIPLVVAEPNASGEGLAVQVIEPLVGGGGGRKGRDGIDGRDNSISNLANNPVEMVEAETGVEVLEYGLRPDSAGAGQWRGGCGQRIRIRIRQEGTFILARGMERLRFQPWGAQQGQPGASTRLTQYKDNSQQSLGKIDMLPLQPGETLLLETPGGGGWGAPWLRDINAVEHDVHSGLLSREAAAEQYGVVWGESAPDLAATEARRAVLAGNPPPAGGNARQNWQAVFDADAMDRLNTLLYPLGGVRGRRLRASVMDPVLAVLPADFPVQRGDTDAAQRLFIERVNSLANELA